MDIIANDILIHAIVGLIIVSAFGVLSIKLRIVSFSGLIAGFIVGYIVWIFGGWTWFIIILMFHLSAAFFTKFKYKRKVKQGLAQEKGGARGWPNVFANGGFPTICAALEGIFVILIIGGAFDIFLFGFIGAVATMTADTIATETGLLSKTNPRLVTKLRKVVEPGSSGGVTILGELGALVGTLIIGGMAWLLAGLGLLASSFTYQLLIAAVVAGMLGCLVDSVFGASIQGIFQCNVCNKITEKAKHCGKKSTHLRGMAFFENNMVNFVASMSGGLIAMGLFLLF
ncbi:MAG: DUF92 domain-containing protein [Candidatus Helarchaeota archaeon]|nr:DUF92 domain-containing protein [Candidatus Helarchaeota archaeon]